MGKKALGDIKEKIDKIIETRKKDFRKILNKETHTYTIEPLETKNQIISQLKYVRRFSPLTDVEYDSIISKAVSSFVQNVKVNLEASSGNRFVGHSITIPTDPQKPRNIFDIIGRARKDPLEALRKELAEKLFDNYRTSENFYLDYAGLSDKELLAYKSSSRKYRDQARREKDYSNIDVESATKYSLLEESLFGYFTNNKNIQRDEANIPQRSLGGLQLGHVKSSAVNKFLLSDIAEDIIDGTIRKELRSLGVRVGLVSAFKRASKDKYLIEVGTKNFEIEVQLFEEGSRNNQGDSSKEKAELNKAIGTITSILYKELAKENWAEQKGSSSYKDAVIAAVTNKAINDFTKIGGRTKNKKLPVDTRPSSLIGEIAAESTSKMIKGNRKANTIKTPTITQPIKARDKSQKNWSNLLPIINQRLTPKVIANMRFPSLVNRTGTFASSAKVVSVTETAKGLPSFTFDYDRNPYDVFDRTKGRPPWNTPERDPRTLVDKSVREVLKEMAIGRFYTRRV